MPEQKTQGVAIVLDAMREEKKLDGQRSLLQRMVSPDTEALDARVRAQFGERYLSMDSSGDGLVFRFEYAQPGDQTTLRLILRDHDPDVKTPRQLKVEDKPNARKRLLALDIPALRAKLDQDMAGVLADILNALEDLQKVLEDG